MENTNIYKIDNPEPEIKGGNKLKKSVASMGEYESLDESGTRVSANVHPYFILMTSLGDSCLDLYDASSSPPF